MPNEFLLVLDDGGPLEDVTDVLQGKERKTPRREKGAYYKNIERKMLLKKKRANVRFFLLPLSGILIDLHG